MSRYRPLAGSRVAGGSPAGIPEAGHALAPRQETAYDCDRGHSFTRVYAANVEPPARADCHCGGTGHLPGTPPGGSARTPAYGPCTYQEKGQRPIRPPMDYVLERRSIKDLEALLEEALAEVRRPEVAR